MSGRVKVCGFTRLADVQAAVACGVDAFGFNFAKGPRVLTVEQARPLVAAVPPLLARVALFLNADYDTILYTVQKTRCTMVQLHGDEPPELAERLMQAVPVIKAWRVRDGSVIQAASDYPCDIILLDAYQEGVAGGTGHAFDHGLLAGWQAPRPWMLAGGLNPQNVATAIAGTQAWAVDTASGVESAPAKKDAAVMAAFVQAARAAWSEE